MNVKSTRKNRDTNILHLIWCVIECECFQTHQMLNIEWKYQEFAIAWNLYLYCFLFLVNSFSIRFLSIHLNIGKEMQSRDEMIKNLQICPKFLIFNNHSIWNIKKKFCPIYDRCNSSTFVNQHVWNSILVRIITNSIFVKHLNSKEKNIWIGKWTTAYKILHKKPQHI